METAVKTALITGATSGIGRELANCFAQDKYNLVIVARDQAELDQTAQQIESQHGVQVLPLAADLFDPRAPQQVYQRIQAEGLQIDALVNDAGQGQYGEFIDNDLDRELDIVQLNIGAYVSFTKFYLREMVERGSGEILQVSSIGGELPGPLQAVYHGTKAFVTSFTEAIRAENKGRGVHITLLLPGVTDTDFFRKADMEQSKLVAEGSKADAAQVAKDGYEALKADKDKIISGLKNKLQVGLSNLMPDDMVADNMLEQGKPSEKAGH